MTCIREGIGTLAGTHSRRRFIALWATGLVALAAAPATAEVVRSTHGKGPRPTS